VNEHVPIGEDRRRTREHSPLRRDGRELVRHASILRDGHGGSRRPARASPASKSGLSGPQSCSKMVKPPHYRTRLDVSEAGLALSVPHSHVENAHELRQSRLSLRCTRIPTEYVGKRRYGSPSKCADPGLA
jgi:hypothetical protein